jgi:hypothetical protein
MNFEKTEEQQLADESLRKFLDTEIQPALTAYGEGKVSKEPAPKFSVTQQKICVPASQEHDRNEILQELRESP